MEAVEEDRKVKLVVLVDLVEEAHVLGELPLLVTSVLLVELILAVVALVAVEEEVVKPTA